MAPPPPCPSAGIEGGPARAVFENPDNDFPQRIIYERTGDTLHARIEGTVEGTARSVSWTWHLVR